MKAINFETLPIMRISKKASLKLGEWKGDVDLVVVCMDDFDMVLDMKFLFKHNVIFMTLA